MAELDNQTVTSGSQLRLKCNISGDPEPVVRWYLENRQLISGKECRIVQGSGYCELIVDSVRKEQEGRLAVEAENEFGKAHSVCFLTVQGNSELTQLQLLQY